jgi:hypothetical protein
MKTNMNVMVDIDNKEVELPLFVNNKYCGACSVGAVCLADGPIPDFEIAAIAGLFGIAD